MWTFFAGVVYAQVLLIVLRDSTLLFCNLHLHYIGLPRIQHSCCHCRFTYSLTTHPFAFTMSKIQDDSRDGSNFRHIRRRFRDGIPQL